MRALRHALPALLLAGLLLMPAAGLAQIRFQGGDPLMTVLDAGQAVPVGGPKKGARPLAVGDNVRLQEERDGLATVEVDEPGTPALSLRRFRLPRQALATQPGKTFADKPSWLPSPAEATAVARDVAAYEDDQSIMVLEGAAKPRRMGKGTSPALSPDGSLLAYSPAPEGGLTVVDSTGRAKPRHFATQPAEVREIHFAPDGRRLAWRVNDRRPSEVPFAPHDRIETADLSQSDPKPVVIIGEQPPEASFQGFNRAGTALVLFDYNSGSGQVRWIAFDGKTLRQESTATFTEDPWESSADDYRPSPTEEALMLVGHGVNASPAMMRWLNDTGEALFLSDATSGTNYRLTPRRLAAVTPVWTPDGRRIYFSGLPETPANGRHRLYRMNADGTGLTELGKGFAPSVGTRP